MTQKDAQKQIENAMLDTLKGSGLNAEQGVAAIMSAVLDILQNVADLTGNPRKPFIKQVLAQVFAQV